jgi:RNA polymerase sigma-70 factor (ECF subfamily)
VLAALVDRARQGDEEAFAALVSSVGDRCMAIAFRILRDFDLAEDAVQTAFVSAWRDLRSLRDSERFDAWLHRLLVNACYAESKRRTRRSLQVVELGEPEGWTPDDYLVIQDRDELERGFERLPADQRAVLVFRYYLGLTLPEVAQHLGIPLGTAKSRLHYASIALRAALEADARGVARGKERGA